MTVDHVGRTESSAWVVSGTLAPKGICPGFGLQSRRRHGWRHRRLQDFPAHGDAGTVELRVCRWRCSGSACARGTFYDQ
ncbi:MAG: transposase family protein [Roseovarius sp.]|nr:transposase family protein [Roseovarius sp.]